MYWKRCCHKVLTTTSIHKFILVSLNSIDCTKYGRVTRTFRRVKKSEDWNRMLSNVALLFTPRPVLLSAFLLIVRSLSLAGGLRARNRNRFHFHFQHFFSMTFKLIYCWYNYWFGAKVQKPLSAVLLKSLRLIGIMFRMFHSKTSSLYIKFFMSYLLPVIEYCMVFYVGNSKSSVKIIERIQRTFTRRLFVLCHHSL